MSRGLLVTVTHLCCSRLLCSIVALSICVLFQSRAQADVWDEYNAQAELLANSFGYELNDTPSQDVIDELSLMVGENIDPLVAQWSVTGHGVFLSAWWWGHGHWISWTNNHHHTAFTQRWEGRGHSLGWTRDDHNTETSQRWNDEGHQYAESRRRYPQHSNMGGLNGGSSRSAWRR